MRATTMLSAGHKKIGFWRHSWIISTALYFHAHCLADSTNTFPHYNVRVWQIDDGLPQNSVWAITQTKDGYLWVGTQQGLARFDGVRFVSLDHPSAPELKHGY